ncbi:uncharacterized protein LY89DRAFT_359391 [Mollisia scopiformis]|uniref:Uncharacterized protein n=1 Tax=Mollisia scopiformis TaxID=149040 RepID=A0A132B5B8_MOLSC|nr:uncharacterized protein LY89DRAFT_359391 [Mollisia scopiformis]KUJ07608.1 hypothetical protein LY89DRAFT_359391 [Mollisia scopiformis]
MFEALRFNLACINEYLLFPSPVRCVRHGKSRKLAPVQSHTSSDESQPCNIRILNAPQPQLNLSFSQTSIYSSDPRSGSLPSCATFLLWSEDVLNMLGIVRMSELKVRGIGSQSAKLCHPCRLRHRLIGVDGAAPLSWLSPSFGRASSCR